MLNNWLDCLCQQIFHFTYRFSIQGKKILMYCLLSMGFKIYSYAFGSWLAWVNVRHTAIGMEKWSRKWKNFLSPSLSMQPFYVFFKIDEEIFKIKLKIEEKIPKMILLKKNVPFMISENLLDINETFIPVLLH